MSEIVAKEMVGDQEIVCLFTHAMHTISRIGDKRALGYFLPALVDDVVMQLVTSNCLAGGPTR
jgi:hypothetical protein